MNPIFCALFLWFCQNHVYVTKPWSSVTQFFVRFHTEIVEIAVRDRSIGVMWYVSRWYDKTGSTIGYPCLFTKIVANHNQVYN